MTCVESFFERLRVVSGVVRFATKGSDIKCVGLSGSGKDSSARSSVRVTRTAVEWFVMGGVILVWEGVLGACGGEDVQGTEEDEQWHGRLQYDGRI